jgi:uncharacterized protein (UPF0147 family)
MLSTFILVLYVPILAILVYALYLFRNTTKQFNYTLQVYSAQLIDKSVDEFFKKAVIVAEDKFRDSQLDPDERAAEVIKTACAIASDVLLQHGLNPRDWHLAGMAGVARFREGFDDIKK